LAFVLWLPACGGGGEGPTPPDLAAWTNLSVNLVEAFDVDHGGVALEGRREVKPMDTEYREGIEAWKVETFQNGILVATRWYQLADDGVLLLGEEVVEGMVVVPRTFETPIRVLPYPLETALGQPVQTWTTVSALEEGGSETHRYDNAGKAPLSVPAGTFEAYHLVHTRVDAQGGSHQLDEYFAPDHGFVRFEYPEGDVWSLRP